MAEISIIGKVLKWKDSMNQDEVKLADGFSFNQTSVLNKVELYRNSKFETGLYEGKFRKFFYNITGFRCDVETKTIDLDTKDFRFLAENGQSYFATWFMEREFRQWMKEAKWGQTLNEIFENLPIWGTIVLKKMKSGFSSVQLKNLINEQTAASLEKSGYVVELHWMSPEEARAMGWGLGEALERVIAEYYQSDEQYLEIAETYYKQGGKWNRYIIAGINLKRIDQNNPKKEHSLAEVVDEKYGIAFPYREIHRRKIRGRWLGVGVVEEAFEPQIAINELVNMNRKGLHWSQLHIFQTRSTNFNRNLLRGADNGDIVATDSEIEPIAVESRDLAGFNSEFQRWISLADQITFTYDVVRGERLPAGTPLGSAQLQTFQATSLFEFRREKVALELKELIYNDIIPEFKKEKRGQHTVLIVGEDKDKYTELLLEANTKQSILDYVRRNGDVPTLDQINRATEIARARLSQQSYAEADLPDSFYEDLRYKFDILITDESVDTAAKLQTIQIALQLIASNPMVLSDPNLKKGFERLLALAGINPVDLFADTKYTAMSQQPMMPQGGSISVPNMSNMQTRMSNQTPV